MSVTDQAFDVRTALWHLRHGGPSAVARYRRRLRVPRAITAAPSQQDKQLSFAPAQWPDAPPVFADVTAAVILDDFSARALRYEWNQVALTRGGWRESWSPSPWTCTSWSPRGTATTTSGSTSSPGPPG